MRRWVFAFTFHLPSVFWGWVVNNFDVSRSIPSLLNWFTIWTCNSCWLLLLKTLSWTTVWILKDPTLHRRVSTQMKLYSLLEVSHLLSIGTTQVKEDVYLSGKLCSYRSSLVRCRQRFRVCRIEWFIASPRRKSSHRRRSISISSTVKSARNACEWFRPACWSTIFTKFGR